MRRLRVVLAVVIVLAVLVATASPSMAKPSKGKYGGYHD